MASYVGQNLIRLMLRNKIDVTKARVGIMGITFKENCPDIRNSKITDIIKELKDWDVDVVVSDPWASQDEVLEQLNLTLSVIDENNPVDSLIVAVGHQEYRDLDVSILREYCRSDSPVLVDVKSLFNRSSAEESGFTIFRL